MKSLIQCFILALSISTIPHTTYAQNWNEWFHQNKTQKKYLLQQIALLQLYLADLQKGFNICREGLNVVHQVKNGEFNLHNLFFSSLKSVNPAVLKYARVAETVSVYASLYQNAKNLLSSAKGTGRFTSDEISMIETCLVNLTDEAGKSLDDLITLTTNGDLQMTDDERIARIDKIYKEVSLHRTSLQTMNADIQSLSRQRLSDQVDLMSEKNWFNLP